MHTSTVFSGPHIDMLCIDHSHQSNFSSSTDILIQLKNLGWSDDRIVKVMKNYINPGVVRSWSSRKSHPWKLVWSHGSYIDAADDDKVMLVITSNDYIFLLWLLVLYQLTIKHNCYIMIAIVLYQLTIKHNCIMIAIAISTSTCYYNMYNYIYIIISSNHPYLIQGFSWRHN